MRKVDRLSQVDNIVTITYVQQTYGLFGYHGNHCELSASPRRQVTLNPGRKHFWNPSLNINEKMDAILAIWQASNSSQFNLLLYQTESYGTYEALCFWISNRYRKWMKVVHTRDIALKIGSRTWLWLLSILEYRIPWYRGYLFRREYQSILCHKTYQAIF